MVLNESDIIIVEWKRIKFSIIHKMAFIELFIPYIFYNNSVNVNV